MTNLNVIRARNLLERIHTAVLAEDFDSAAQDSDRLLNQAAVIIMNDPTEDDLRQIGQVLSDLADTAGWPFSRGERT